MYDINYYFSLNYFFFFLFQYIERYSLAVIWIVCVCEYLLPYGRTHSIAKKQWCAVCLVSIVVCRLSYISLFIQFSVFSPCKVVTLIARKKLPHCALCVESNQIILPKHIQSAEFETLLKLNSFIQIYVFVGTQIRGSTVFILVLSTWNH